MRFFVGTKTGGIVTTHFIDTSSVRSGAVIFANDNVRIGRETTLEVRTYRSHKYDKHIFICRMPPHLSTCSDQQRTNVKRSTCLVWRNETFVQFHHFQNSCLETFSRKFSHQDSLTSRLQTGCILFQTENTHFTVFSTKSFQAFKRFLTIMQARSCHVQIQMFVTAHFQFSPCSIAEINSHIVVCLHVAKRQIRPVYFFHIVMY